MIASLLKTLEIGFQKQLRAQRIHPLNDSVRKCRRTAGLNHPEKEEEFSRPFPGKGAGEEKEIRSF